MSKIYTKKQLISDVAKTTGLTQGQIMLVFETVASIQKKQLKNGKIVKTQNGQIRIIEQKARKGINPQTGKKIQIKSCRKPKFIFNTNFKKSFKK